MNPLLRNIIAMVGFSVAAVLIGLGISVRPANTNPNVPDLVPLPDEKEVVSIRASAQDGFLNGESIPEFTVPPKYFSVILGALTPAKKCEDCQFNIKRPIAEFRIATNNARSIHVRVGDSGQNPLCFSVDGVPCARDGPYCPRGEFGIDEGARMQGFVQALYRKLTEGSQDQWLDFFMNDLEWSRGQKQTQRKLW